jgi:integrase
MRAIHRLSAVKVATLKQPGYYADGGSLYLRVAPGGSKGWIFRFTIAGRTRDAGLGAFPTVGLVAARVEAQQRRQLVAAGVDPIEARKKDREAARIASGKATTFEQCAKAFIASHEAGWRSDIHRRQWRKSLVTHALPVIGALPVQAVDTALVLKVLEPLWKEKPETASRVRQRIERVLSWAKVRGYREGENPAVWRGHLDQLLPPKRKVRQVAHHAAMPYREIGALMAKLRSEAGLPARALEFLILTATRTGEALGARWVEIDLDQRMWTIPAGRMKASREHRVPLSERAIAILNEIVEIRHNEFVFPSAKQGRPLTRNVLLRLLHRLSDGEPAVTPHGFRSSFREWAAEATNFPREAAELALAHAVGDSVERAYQRGDLLEKRRKLMEAWARYCGPVGTSEVIQLRNAAAKS